jgi:DNA transposition AAA+ family ATPase
MIPADRPLAPIERGRIEDDLKRFLAERGYTQADLARGVRENQADISQLLSGADKLKLEKRDELLRKATAWMELEYRAVANRRPSNFAQTRVAKRMYAIARKLTERADIGICWGPAGIGKSTVIAAIQAELPNVIVVAVRDSTRCRGTFLRALWGAMNLRQRRGGRASLYELVAEQLRQSARVATRPLLVIDQAHLLAQATQQIIMDLHDECAASVLLVGTVDVHRRVTDDEDVRYGQFSSRVGLRCDLCPELFGGVEPCGRRKLFTVDDIRRIFQSGKVRLAPDALNLLCETANASNGHLRRVDRLVHWAEAVARKGVTSEHAVTITAKHLRAAERVVVSDELRREAVAAS